MTPSDLDDVIPGDPTVALGEIDRRVPKVPGFQSRIPNLREFAPEGVDTTPETERPVYAGIVLEKHTHPSTDPAHVGDPNYDYTTYDVLLSDNRTLECTRQANTIDADFNTGDEVVVISGPAEDEWLIVGSPTPHELSYAELGVPRNTLRIDVAGNGTVTFAFDGVSASVPLTFSYAAPPSAYTVQTHLESISALSGKVTVTEVDQPWMQYWPSYHVTSSLFEDKLPTYIAASTCKVTLEPAATVVSAEDYNTNTQQIFTQTKLITPVDDTFVPTPAIEYLNGGFKVNAAGVYDLRYNVISKRPFRHFSTHAGHPTENGIFNAYTHYRIPWLWHSNAVTNLLPVFQYQKRHLDWSYDYDTREFTAYHAGWYRITLDVIVSAEWPICTPLILSQGMDLSRAQYSLPTGYVHLKGFDNNGYEGFYPIQNLQWHLSNNAYGITYIEAVPIHIDGFVRLWGDDTIWVQVYAQHVRSDIYGNMLRFMLNRATLHVQELRPEE